VVQGPRRFLGKGKIIEYPSRDILMLMIIQNPAGNSADDDWWGTRDLNNCCGRMNVKIPSDIAAGDYLLRAEVIALHVAGSTGGAQLYMSCCMSLPPLNPISPLLTI
jgi:hypothetical protein